LGLTVTAALLGASCSTAPQPGARVRSRGPARIQLGLVGRHARQFDQELARREAGSQEEGAAAAYILGHLQRAGFVVRLVGVPVANTVSSIDVVGLPSGGGDPAAVVAVPYDSAPGASNGNGAAIGVFLELARALNAARPGHDVELVALGAENAPVGGGHLGSRRLARLLVDSQQRPVVITIENLGGRLRGRFGASGSGISRLTSVAAGLGIPVTRLPAPPRQEGAGLAERHRIFTAAGLEHIAVAGGVGEVGRVLLEYLTARPSS